MLASQLTHKLPHGCQQVAAVEGAGGFEVGLVEQSKCDLTG